MASVQEAHMTLSAGQGAEAVGVAGLAGEKPAPATSSPFGHIRVAKKPHWGRWAGGVVVIAIIGGLGYAVGTTPNIKWPAVGQYFSNSAILSGLVVTLELTVLAMAIGVGLGILLALMRLSMVVLFKASSGIYIWFFRGTPLLVQIIAWYNIGLVFPSIDLFGYHVGTNSLISPFTAAVLALGLNEGAYMSEIVRAGIMSIPHGQMDAALMVGLTRRQAMRSIVIPQSLRVIVPPTGNQTIGMLKTTSLVSVIAAQDLLTKAQYIYAKNFLVIELLIVASLWYLVLTTVASIGQYFLEKKIGVGSRRSNTRPLNLWAEVGRQLSRPLSMLTRRGGVHGS
jgi:polar amino acid transport system permease protein